MKKNRNEAKLSNYIWVFKKDKYVYTDIIAILLVYYILSIVQLQAIILDCTILIICVYWVKMWS